MLQQNFNSPFGFTPVGYLNGSTWSGQGRIYYIPQSDNHSYAIGDPVATTSGADSNGVARVTIGVAGSPVRGVIVECLIGSKQNLGENIIPAVKARDHYVMVVDDPQVIFEIQEGGTGVSLSSSAVNQYANFLAAANNGYVSQFVLDNSTVSSTNTLDMLLMGLAQVQGNYFGSWAKWLVLFQNHELI